MTQLLIFPNELQGSDVLLTQECTAISWKFLQETCFFRELEEVFSVPGHDIYVWALTDSWQPLFSDPVRHRYLLLASDEESTSIQILEKDTNLL
ncbi:hypothetical protein AVEN_24308-1 [Araneus ventricosus]|uniref:Uncharacterized protein n=1 Tax=Araneus ventricosus TaxID=182803 RepID=A0A4Y2PBT3_ARAVE|nr:hypothetical protein AVEN_24308-1 [Araneus ventricosus]